MTAETLVVETLVPFMYFGPRRVQAIGAGITVAFQCLIFLTGNYTFFNVLTIALALWLLDDETVLAGVPQRFVGRARRILPGPPSGRRRWPAQVAVAILVFVNAVTFWEGAAARCRRTSPSWKPASSRCDSRALRPVRGDDYDATGDRPRRQRRRHDVDVIRFYQSRVMSDGRRGCAVSPAPRLADVVRRAQRPVERPVRAGAGTTAARRIAPVRALLAPGPWTDHPPRYIRATLYDYRFTDWTTGRANGAWWKRGAGRRTLLPLTLDADGALRRVD